jgi:rhomboid protease GluP
MSDHYPSSPVQPVYPPAPRRLLFRPYVTFTLIGISVGMFLLQMASQALLGGDVLFALGGKINQSILAGQLWRLFTPMFLHGSIIHIAFNMYALFNFGPGLELHYGRWRFLALYLLGGFAGNVMSFMFSANPSLGSSTAIFGLLGAEGVFLYHNRALFGDFARRALTQVIGIAVVNLVIGFTANSLIDNWGHIGGLLGGTLFAWFAGPLLHREGLFPPYKLVDQRDPREVVLAGAGVGFLFVVLTAAVFFMKG